MPTLTLITSSYKRCELLEQDIPSWLHATQPEEIIVINDGPADFTENIVEHYRQAHPHINWVFKHHNKPQWQNPCIIHNWAVRQASCDIIAIVDPEIVFITDCIGQLKEALEDNELLFVNAGTFYDAKPLIHFTPDELLHPETIRQRPEVVEYYTGYYSTDNDIVRMPHCASHYFGGCYKSLWVAVRGKDERFVHGWGNEDLDLMARMRRYGAEHRAIAEMEIVHRSHILADGRTSDLIQHNHRLRERNDEAGLIQANEEGKWGVI
jgi:glycosyltransferase involved in cell wall biosynthesis